MAARDIQEPDLLPEVRELDEAEWRDFVDEQARELVGMSGDEFYRRWTSGEFDQIIDHPDHWDLMYLASLSGVR